MVAKNIAVAVGVGLAVWFVSSRLAGLTTRVVRRYHRRAVGQARADGAPRRRS